MKVFIAEDNIDSMYLLKTLLKKSGYRTVTAQNGSEALKKLKKNKVDLIISDILMPKMDGFQLCRACKKDDKLSKIPFIFYTATYRRKQDEEFALSLGADKFIIKPQEPEILLRIIHDTLREHKEIKSEAVSKQPVKEEQYLTMHSRRIIRKLEDKVKSLNEEIIRRKKTEDELYQKIKELNCLYFVANLTIKPDKPLEKIFKEVVKSIPQGMHCPEKTYSRIIFDKKEFKSGNFKKAGLKECEDIKVEGNKEGAIEVYSAKKGIGASKDKSLKEEKKLINGVSKIISVYIERKRALEKLKESYHKIKLILDCVISAMSYIVEAGDPYTSGHQKKVALLATAIAEEMGLNKNQVEAINMAALIHDIGKIRIPASILSKPGKLSEIEFKMIETHCQVGHDILEKIEFPYPIAKIVAQHHERLNGSGYPKGLKSKDISIEAKVIAVADAMEAMVSHRPYRPALGMDKAIKEIMSGSGKLYDPEVVNVCIKLFKKKNFRFNTEKESMTIQTIGS